MLTPDPELAVAYGLFSIQQARDAGIGRAELERGLRNGRWERAARAIDSAVRVQALSLAELEAHFAGSTRNGIPGGRRVLAAVDPLSGSVPETEARLVFRQAGLRPPTSQLPISINGRLIANADFGWPEEVLIAEIDGFGPHSELAVFEADRTKGNRLGLAGWLVLRYTREAKRAVR